MQDPNFRLPVPPSALRRGSRDGEKVVVVPLNPRPSLTEAAAAQLRELIVTGQLPAGSPLTEHGLAEFMRISKTPVREALALLRVEGLVTILPHRGTFVLVPDPAEAVPICAHWTTLSAAALRAAAARDHKGLLGSLALVRRQMALVQVGDERAFIRHEADVFMAFFAHSGNTFLADAYRLVASKITAMRVNAGRLEIPISSANLEMEALFKAVEEGDLDRATVLLATRIERIGAFLEQVFSEPQHQQASNGSLMPIILPFLPDEGILTLIQELSFYIM